MTISFTSIAILNLFILVLLIGDSPKRIESRKSKSIKSLCLMKADDIVLVSNKISAA